MKVSTDTTLIREVLSRAVGKIYPSPAAFEKALLSGKRLRLYLGIDPTSPHLHIGHAASLWILRRFQNLGHEIILLVGDFTARIGDPTDKLSPRQPLTDTQVKDNLRTFKKQVEKIISFGGPNAARLEFNSEWHDAMTFGKLIKLAQSFTVQQMIERDMFQKRIKAGKPIGLHEFLYPLMQGYDSVAMDVDAEVGGTDQIFNMLAGRTLMKTLKHKEKFVIANRLLVDTASGKKLSKTEGSLVNLDAEPNDMFGKVMAIPDGMIPHVAELSTDIPMEEVKKLGREKNPRDAKLILAETAVSLYHSPAAAKKAREEWVRVFSKKEKPQEMLKLSIPKEKLPHLGIVGLFMLAVGGSKSNAWRQIQAGSVRVNDKIITDVKEPMGNLDDGDVLQIGKRHFFKLKVK